MILNVFKVFGLGISAFFIGFSLTPLLTHYLYKYKLWRKEPRKFAPDGTGTPIFTAMHAERETTIPRMGGILIWFVPLAMIFLFKILASFFSASVFFQKLNFLSRAQTWLAIFTLTSASLVGLADDFFQVYGRGKYIAGGMRFSRRLILIILIASAGAWWFYSKLGRSGVFIPFWGELALGVFFPFFFMLTMVATFSGGVIDGLDGLAGGVLAAAFSAYAGIAFFQNQIDLAAFGAVAVGSILAFLWFNIPPARFYMGESGIMGLTATLTVLAFLTNSVLVLPVIALPLVLAAGSSLIQLVSKNVFGRKVFKVAPLHHHLEAIGWPAYKVTMRFWIIGIVFAVIGMIIAVIGNR